MSSTSNRQRLNCSTHIEFETQDCSIHKLVPKNLVILDLSNGKSGNEYALYISGEDKGYAIDKHEFIRIAKELYGKIPFDKELYDECDIYDVSDIIRIMDGSPRIIKMLEVLGIKTLEAFFKVPLEKFMCLRNVGKKTISELIKRLAGHHIVLTGNLYTSPKNQYFKIED